jgi:glycine betaine/choline ABC-type transport system substrate-binding protein
MARTRTILALLAAVAAAAMLSACGDDRSGRDRPASVRLIQRDPANADRPALVIGSKAFSEQFILAAIYAQALEAGGFRVTRRPPAEDERAAYRDLKRGEIHAYPEYTGTALTTLYGEASERVPRDGLKAYEQARRRFAGDVLAALPPTPFSNSNGFAMRREAADTLGVTTLSSLTDEAQELVLSGPPECARRADCKLGLERVYNLRFAEFRPVPIAARHESLADDTADVAVVFTTDGQIRTENLALLEDDKGMLPANNVTLVLRSEALRAAGPALPRIVSEVQQGLTTSVMQELNSRVDLDGETPELVAHSYLRDAGYVE